MDCLSPISVEGATHFHFPAGLPGTTKEEDGGGGAREKTRRARREGGNANGNRGSSGDGVEAVKQEEPIQGMAVDGPRLNSKVRSKRKVIVNDDDETSVIRNGKRSGRGGFGCRVGCSSTFFAFASCTVGWSSTGVVGSSTSPAAADEAVNGEKGKDDAPSGERTVVEQKGADVESCTSVVVVVVVVRGGHKGDAAEEGGRKLWT